MRDGPSIAVPKGITEIALKALQWEFPGRVARATCSRVPGRRISVPRHQDLEIEERHIVTTRRQCVQLDARVEPRCDG